MKLIIDLLGWVPVLGTSLKLLYISKLTKDALTKIQIPEKKANENSDSGSDYFQELATDLYDEHLATPISELGLPDFIVEKAKTKAIEEIANELKKKYEARVTK